MVSHLVVSQNKMVETLGVRETYVSKMMCGNYTILHMYTCTDRHTCTCTDNLILCVQCVSFVVCLHIDIINPSHANFNPLPTH